LCIGNKFFVSENKIVNVLKVVNEGLWKKDSQADAFVPSIVILMLHTYVIHLICFLLSSMRYFWNAAELYLQIKSISPIWGYDYKKIAPNSLPPGGVEKSISIFFICRSPFPCRPAFSCRLLPKLHNKVLKFIIYRRNLSNFVHYSQEGSGYRCTKLHVRAAPQNYQQRNPVQVHCDKCLSQADYYDHLRTCPPVRLTTYIYQSYYLQFKCDH